VTRAAGGQPSARERLLNARSQTPSLKREGIKGFRDVVSEVHDLGGASAKAAQSAREIPRQRPTQIGPAHFDLGKAGALHSRRKTAAHRLDFRQFRHLAHDRLKTALI